VPRHRPGRLSPEVHRSQGSRYERGTPSAPAIRQKGVLTQRARFSVSVGVLRRPRAPRGLFPRTRPRTRVTSAGRSRSTLAVGSSPIQQSESIAQDQSTLPVLRECRSVELLTSRNVRPFLVVREPARCPVEPERRCTARPVTSIALEQPTSRSPGAVAACAAQLGVARGHSRQIEGMELRCRAQVHPLGAPG
jgi:hypothetical protein